MCTDEDSDHEERVYRLGDVYATLFVSTHLI
jgi:hypothetical protein